MAPLDDDVKSLALSPSFFLINSSTTDKNINCSVFKKNALYLSVNVFSTKVLMGTLFFTPIEEETAIFRGHPSHAKDQPFAGQRQYLYFAVILRPWALVRPRESNPRPPALHSSALPTELILPRFKTMAVSSLKPLISCARERTDTRQQKQARAVMIFMLWFSFKLVFFRFKRVAMQ